MKKYFSILLGILIIGSSVPLSFAQGGVSNQTQINTDTPAELDSPIMDTLEWDKLDQERTKAIEDRNKLMEDREKLQRELSTARQNGDEASIASKTEELSKLDGQIVTKNNAINEYDKSIESNTAYKISQIEEKYSVLITSTLGRESTIAQEKQRCITQVGNDAEKKAFCERYYDLQARANQEYAAFLVAQRNVELCQAKPECAADAAKLEGYRRLARTKSDAVAKTLSEITQEEIKKNQQATFDVSDIFSLSENTPGDDVEPTAFLDVTDTIANWLITLVSSLAVTALIIGGFIMIISGGDENRLEMGKTIFIYALIGLIVVLMSYGIITFIQSLFYPEASNIPPDSPSSVKTPASPTPAPVQEGVDFIPPPDPAQGLPS